jgi:sortase (surface protein transpeptidase)
VQEIVGPTPNETITLITCTGVFDRNVLEYDKRLVVKAERSPLASLP